VIQWKAISSTRGNYSKTIADILQRIERKIDLSSWRPNSATAEASSVLNNKINTNPELNDFLSIINYIIDDDIKKYNDVVIPDGISTQELLAMSPANLINDGRINSQNYKLDKTMYMSFQKSLCLAKGISEALNFKLIEKVLAASETLRSEGEFIDYNVGEEYVVVDGVETFADKTPEGKVRIYYFYKDRFQELYGLKMLKNDIDNLLTKKIISYFK
jgi:hypothetical protein